MSLGNGLMPEPKAKMRSLTGQGLRARKERDCTVRQLGEKDRDGTKRGRKEKKRKDKTLRTNDYSIEDTGKKVL